MTQILIDEYSEVNKPAWTYDTLRPPELTLKNTYKDIEWHIHLYRKSGLSFLIIVAFIFFRIFQHVFYNLGWQDGGKAFEKS